MTHTTSTRRPEDGMKGTMTANGRLGASRPGGAKELRNAPRAGHSLRCSADPFHRGSERSRDAGSGPRTGTPPFKRESGHAQPGRAHGEEAPARSRGRRWFKSARAGRGTGSGTRTLFAPLAAGLLVVLAALAFASPARSQTTNTIWSSWVLLKAHESESSLPGYGADYPNSILLRDEFVYDHTTFRVTSFTNLKNLSLLQNS